MDSKLIDIAGGRTKIRVYEAGDGEPLLFLHGAGGLFPDDPFVAKLAERYHVFAPMLPGYDDSEGGEGIRDMLAFTLHTFDVMDALGLEKPVVVGHSMGGMIAAEMAAIAPHAIDRLALIAPAGLWLDEHPIPDIFAKLPFEFPALLFHDVEMGANLLTAGLDLDDEAFLTEFLITNSRQFGMAGKILFPIPDRGLAERLYRIRAKTVVIWGNEDALIVPKYGEAFRDAIDGADLVGIPEAGHMVTLEQPDAVLESIAGLG
jgi:pimeloyl-ACP methyl ester carboxylesterase